MPIGKRRFAARLFVEATLTAGLLCRAGAEVKTRTEVATSNRHEYSIEMGGTMDGVNTRSPIGYRPWRQKFRPNISVRIAARWARRDNGVR